MKMEIIEILLVEDNPGDVRLIQEALKENKIVNNLHIADDGIQALEFLNSTENPVPDLILLDLNLPRMDGREVLEEIKSDIKLKIIPVVILTTSSSDEDILKTYNLHANCYITKPVDLDKFIQIVKKIGKFWFSIVKLPPKD